MKKLTLAILGVLVVSACTNNFATITPIEKRDNLNHICIKEAKKPRLPSFVPSIVNSLKNKGITSQVYVNSIPKESCKYMLNYAINTRNDVVLRTTIRVQELEGDDYTKIGEVVYKQRSAEEQALSKSQGVQGQADRIVAELFKNY
ncbi:hypothetical protein MZA89_02595 [Haemophilus influenzae]|nr:hypothetical protein [Haemophilus influenzae]